jgi:hypothetical protein
MMANFRQSKFWQLTLAARKDDPDASARERLRNAYDIFWDRGIELAQRISSDLPSLTLHDERHLTALWDRASQLISDSWPINPLEAFVFGGAILLHDSGHALAAYNGGLAELQQSIEYKDAMAALLRNRDDNQTDYEMDSTSKEEIVRDALLTTLRRVHAKQADSLATRDFMGLHLIEDYEIRHNIAQLIGRVAASHHWERNSLEAKLPDRRGPPGFMPQEWSIQPVKLACLLRCSDAIQIDQRRAPAFALALHAPQGESELHWLAQQLAQPMITPDSSGGPGALVFTSQNDFTEDKADAWWIAHDLIKTAHQELEGCYELMKDLNLPVFTVDRVAGAESPIHLARYIQTAGWRPVSAEVRVSSVRQMVSLFGGQLLYGRNLSVPLRELLQNASDAVRARRALDPLYQGRVVVGLKEERGWWQLVVEDDGIGMSERVLTGPLIEFGKTFWASEDVQDEFPGLMGANLRQGGRYGIGFFSTLMIAQRIEVTSRRWDAGQDSARKLTLRDGLRLRPLVSTNVETPLGQFSTRVILHVKAEDVDELLTVARPRGISDKSGYKLNLNQLVAHLCPCLDCEVSTREGSTFQTAHSRRWYESDPQQWVGEVVLAASRVEQPIDRYLAEIAPLIRELRGPDGEPCGRAAIAFGEVSAGVDSVNGLVAAGHLRSIDNFSTAYVGSIGFEPSGPRRDSGVLSSPPHVKAWASEQAELMGQLKRNDAENYLAAMNVAEFGGDPTPIAMVLINRQFQSLATVYDMLAEGKNIFAVVGQPTVRGPAISTVVYRPSRHHGFGFAWNELDFPILVMEAWSGRHFPDQVYHLIPAPAEPTPSCFLSCLKRYSESKGHVLQLESAEEVLLATYRGEASPREKLVFGAELRGQALMISMKA